MLHDFRLKVNNVIAFRLLPCIIKIGGDILTVCERIDDILKSRKMSRRQLAIQAGIPPSSLQSAMERNKGISLNMLFSISDVLGVDPRFLDPDTSSFLKPISRHKMNELQDGVDSLHFDINFPIVKKYFERLNATGQEVALERIKELTEIPRYQRYQKEGEQSAVDPQENE